MFTYMFKFLSCEKQDLLKVHFKKYARLLVADQIRDDEVEEAPKNLEEIKR